MRLFAAITFLLFTVSLSAQKVKEKDNVFYVDKEPFLKKDCRSFYAGPCVLLTPDGQTRVVSVISYEYMDKRKVYEDKTWQMKEVKAYYYELRFLTAEGSMHTYQHPKLFIKEMYRYQLINENGAVDQEKLDEFIKIFHKEPPVRVIGY